MTKKLSSNILIYGLTNVLKSLVPLFMLPILTFYLSIEEFGVLSLIETSILFITPFILLNINSAITVEYFILPREELKTYITNALLLTFISFSILLTIFFIFKEFLSNIFSLTENIILLMVLFAFLRVISTVTLAIYQVEGEAKKFAIFTLFQTFLDFLLSYLFVAFFNYGYLGRLEGIYIAFFIASIVGTYLLIKMNYIGKVTFSYSKNILLFGLPLIPHAISGTIMAMSDRYFISYYIGNTDVGLYSIAYQMSAVMLLVGMSVNQAWSPILFSLLKKKDIYKVLIYTSALFILFSIVAFIIYFSKDLLFYIFVDETYYQSKDFFLYLLIGFIFQSFYFLVTNILFFEKKTVLLAKITIFGAILNIILNYYFIQIYGTIGVAYATAITWAMFFVIVGLINIKIIKAYINHG